MKLEISDARSATIIDLPRAIGTIGSAPNSAVLLPEGTPLYLAEIRALDGGVALVVLDQQTRVTVDGAPVAGQSPLREGAVIGIEGTDVRVRVVAAPLNSAVAVEERRQQPASPAPWSHTSTLLRTATIVLCLGLAAWGAWSILRGTPEPVGLTTAPAPVLGKDTTAPLAPPQPSEESAGRGSTAPTLPSPEATASPLTLARQSTVKVVSISASGEPVCTGSGVVVGPHHILTNSHVLEDAVVPLVEVKEIASGTQLTLYAQVCFYDRKEDVAVLRVDLPRWARPVSIAARPPAVGAKVLAVGAPFGLEDTVTDGLVSAIRSEDGANWIQTSSPVSPGSSGGGLFSEGGELLGIMTKKITAGEGLGFAVPAERFRTIMSSLDTLSPIAPKDLANKSVETIVRQIKEKLARAGKVQEAFDRSLFESIPSPLTSLVYLSDAHVVSYATTSSPYLSRGSLVLVVNGKGVDDGYVVDPFEDEAERSGMVGYVGIGLFRNKSNASLDLQRQPVTSLMAVWTLGDEDRGAIADQVWGRWKPVAEQLCPESVAECEKHVREQVAWALSTCESYKGNVFENREGNRARVETLKAVFDECLSATVPFPVASLSYVPSNYKVSYSTAESPVIAVGSIYLVMNGSGPEDGYSYNPFDESKSRRGTEGYAGIANFRNRAGFTIDLKVQEVVSVKAVWVLTTEEEKKVVEYVWGRWRGAVEALCPEGVPEVEAHIRERVNARLASVRVGDGIVFKQK